MTSTIGIPIKLLNEAQVSGAGAATHLRSAKPHHDFSAVWLINRPGPCSYARDHFRTGVSGQATRRFDPALQSIRLWPDSRTAEDNMNVQLKDITVTARDGRVSHLDQVYIRGSHVRFFIVPDMLR